MTERAYFNIGLGDSKVQAASFYTQAQRAMMLEQEMLMVRLSRTSGIMPCMCKATSRLLCSVPK